MKSTCLILLSVFSPAAAFVSPAPLSHSSATTSLSAQKSRTEFLRDAAGLGIAAAAAATGGGVGLLPAFADETTASGVSIKVIKSGTGPSPTIGELATIRFSAYAGEVKIDDIFDTPEPYFTRVGSGGLIKGVEEVLPKMRVGDRWVLTIPVSGDIDIV
jgi:FKBP-type peptidyl-prolyl cis-trans isomerase